MSQMLTRRPARETLLLHDLYFAPEYVSFLRPVSCSVCGKGLDDGYSLCAENIDGKNTMLCELHASQ